MNRQLFSFILLVFFSLGVHAQNNKNQAAKVESKHDKIVTYQLSQIKGQEQLNELKAELVKFRHVTNVSITDFGQEEAVVLKIFVSEVIKFEGDEGFDQSGLKKFLSSKGIKPSNLKIEVLN